jgi:membrane-bound metal-dependent hydrolase YbcI (DUF457 family)
MILAHVTVPLILYGLFPDLSLLALLFGANVSSFDVYPTLVRKYVPSNPITEYHAASVLHTLFFFIIIFPIVYLAFGSVPAVSFTIGGFTHIFLDALDEKGRMLFYPLSKKFYGVRILTYDFWTYTTSSKIFALEAVLFAISLTLLVLR